MHILSWVDNRTLIACQCILATVFALVLFCMWRLYPQLRGVGSVALGFSLGIPAAVLYTGRGHLPQFFSIVLANCLIFLLYLLLYRGIVEFCQSRGHMPLLLFVMALGTVLLFYFNNLHPDIVARIVVVSVVIGVARSFMAYEVFKRSNGRMHMLLFSLSLAFFGLTSIVKGILSPFQGAPTDYLKRDSIPSTQLLLGVLFVCIDGMFYLTMLIREVTHAIEQQAQLDFLTGTLNRRGIEQALAVEIARTRRSYRPIALLLLDIDHFKTINDAHGHAAGDEALRLVSHSIASVLRVYDTLGRYGGDEFLLILPETASDSAMMIADRIRESLATMSAASRMPPLSLSIGVTHFERDEEPIDIIARADAALYEAKRDGRNCARLHRPIAPGTAPDGPGTPRGNLLRRVTARHRPRNPMP